MKGVEQRITSAYLTQSDGLYERQNCTMKDSLIKVLEVWSIDINYLRKWNTLEDFCANTLPFFHLRR